MQREHKKMKTLVGVKHQRDVYNDSSVVNGNVNTEVLLLS